MILKIKLINVIQYIIKLRKLIYVLVEIFEYFIIFLIKNFKYIKNEGQLYYLRVYIGSFQLILYLLKKGCLLFFEVDLKYGCLFLLFLVIRVQNKFQLM